MMGLSPNDFWGDACNIDTGMTLREFDLFAQGYRKRMDLKQEMLAWATANLMNCWAKKGTKITADKLLGREKSYDVGALKAELEAKSSRNKKDSLSIELNHTPEVIDFDLTSGQSWIESLLEDVGDSLDAGEEAL